MAHPRDVRIAELQAQMEAAKAEIAQLKADEQIEISEEKALNFKAAAKNKKTAIDLEGNRDSEGNLIRGTARNISGVEIDRKEKELEPSISDVTDKKPMDKRAAAAGNISTEQMIEEGMAVIPATVLDSQVEDDTKTRRHNISGVELPLEEEEEKASIRDITDKRPMNFKEAAGDDDEEMITDKQIADPEDDEIQGEAAPEKEKDDDGRRKATEIENLRGEKPGWEMAEDSNFWSVNEKDPYWKTQEGYEEAVNLYGDKPSWLKAQDVGTLVYNPSTGEYEEVEQEEFVDLKPKKRPSL
jgi:hypothetical protein